MDDESPLSGWSVARRPAVRIPPPVERVFSDHLRSAFPRATPARLASEVARLSDRFTADRDGLPGAYLNQPPVRSAYLAYVHPLQVLRGMAVLEEVHARAAARGLWPATPADGALRVLDVGAGLGALSQALLVTAPAEGPTEFTLLDHQKSALRDARALTLGVAAALPGERPAPRVRSVPERVERWVPRARRNRWRYDLVLLGGLLNETPGAWESLVGPVLDVVAEGGLVVIVEPALSEVARDLMALREAWLGRTTTIAPCTHAAACPLLATRRDWCFSVRSAQLSKPVARHARALGHQTRTVRTAFWAFAPRPEAAPPERDEARHARVVTEPMQGRQVLCVEGRRDRADIRAGGAQRGDLAVR